MWLPFPILWGSIWHTGKTVWTDNLKRKYKAELSERIAGLLKTYPDQTQDGPAMRPGTPLAVENGVGKPAAHEAPNVGTGKRVAL
jgi:hypothetical protein